MKVQPYQKVPEKMYPSLVKGAVVAVIAGTVASCQQHEQVLGGLPFLPEEMSVSQGPQDAKGSARTHASDRSDIASAKGKPAMTDRVRVKPQTPVLGD